MGRRGALSIFPRRSFQLEVARIDEGTGRAVHGLVFCGAQAGRRCQIKGQRVRRALHQLHPWLVPPHAAVRRGWLAIPS